VKRNDLLKALIAVKPGIASKKSIESMMYFYFTGTHVIAYNDIVAIQYPLETEFSAFVKADDMFKVVSRIKTDTLTFKLEGSLLKMQSSKMMNDFATIFDDEVVGRIEIVQKSMDKVRWKQLPKSFVEAVKLCMPVASKSESDQMLTCLYVSGEDVISTDNVRIAHYSMESSMEEMMIKATEMKAILDIKPSKYCITKSWIHFKNNDGCIFSIRSIKGSYPNMLKYMDFKGIEITLPESILSGIEIASVRMEDSDDAMKVSIRKGKYRLYNENASGKFDFRDSIKYNGKDIDFSINPSLLAEMMKHSTNIIIGEQNTRLEADNFRLVTSMFVE